MAGSGAGVGTGSGSGAGICERVGGIRGDKVLEVQGVMHRVEEGKQEKREEGDNLLGGCFGVREGREVRVGREEGRLGMGMGSGIWRLIMQFCHF